MHLNWLLRISCLNPIPLRLSFVIWIILGIWNNSQWKWKMKILLPIVLFESSVWIASSMLNANTTVCYINFGVGENRHMVLEPFWKETRHVAMGFELNNFVYIHSGLPIEVTKLKCRIRFCCCSEKKWRRTNEKMVDHLKNMRKFDFPIDRYDNDPYLKHPLLKMNKTKRKKRDKNQAKLVSKKSVTNQR